MNYLAIECPCKLYLNQSFIIILTNQSAHFSVLILHINALYKDELYKDTHPQMRTCSPFEMFVVGGLSSMTSFIKDIFMCLCGVNFVLI